MKLLANKFIVCLRYSCLCAVLFLPIFQVQAQNDTLQIVKVRGMHWLASEPGTKVELMDSAILKSTISTGLADLISRLSTVYFKNYGVNGLASVSMRGTSANHTALMWNGIKVQSPSLQQTDYAILPVFFWDEIGIQFGPTISLNGADIAGGAVHLLNEKPKAGFHSTYLSQLGSFGLEQQALSASYGKSSFFGKTQVNYLTAANDFPLTLPSGKAVNQQNAAITQLNFLQHFYYSNDQFLWKTIYWYGNNDRELPRTISGHGNKNVTDNEQQDKFHRIITSLSGQRNRLDWEIAYNYQKDFLTYNEEENSSSQHIYRAQMTYKLSEKIEFTGGGQVNSMNVKTSSYEVNDKFRSDYFVKGSANVKGWKSHLGFKQIIISEKDTPLIPSLGVEKRLVEEDDYSIKTSGKIARHFRYPTFNDLYWNPGGNPDLKPENGWSSEGTLSISLIKNYLITTSITYYNLNVEDWIIWIPTSDGYWAPENLWRVNSHGLEANLKALFNFMKLPIETNINYSLTKSLNRAEDNKQLIYVPVHQGNMSVLIDKDNLFVSPTISYTGSRYTTQDNRQTDMLPGFSLIDFSVGYKISSGHLNMIIQAECNNLLNTQYQTLLNRAMPGRGYQLQIQLNF